MITMCAIMGLKGNFTGQNLNIMLETLKHRGPDGSGVLVDGNITGTVNIIRGNMGGRLKFADGSLPLGPQPPFKSLDPRFVQPAETDGFIMVCNGEILQLARHLRKV